MIFQDAEYASLFLFVNIFRNKIVRLNQMSDERQREREAEVVNNFLDLL